MEITSVNEVAPRPSVECCYGRCGLLVQVCRSCWRNQKVYRLTPAGQENHKAHQRTYREQKKSESDSSTKVLESLGQLTAKACCCCVCGSATVVVLTLENGFV